MLRTIKNIHFWLCEWNPTAFNQQRWYPSFLRCFFPVYQCAFGWNHTATTHWYGFHEHELLLSRQDLVDLLRAATKGQLFGFSMVADPDLQIRWGRSSRSWDKKRRGWGGGGWSQKKHFRHFAFRVSFWSKFLETFNQCHSSVMFTVEIESNCMLPFLGTQLLNGTSRCGDQSECQTTNTGLLSHYNSHVDVRNKRALLRTMLGQCFPTCVQLVVFLVLNYFFPAKVP